MKHHDITRIGAGHDKVLVMNLKALPSRIGAGHDKVLVMNLKALPSRIGAGHDKVLVMRKGPGLPRHWSITKNTR